jgi:hypothetical protein
MTKCIAASSLASIARAWFRPEKIPTTPRSLQSLNTPLLNICDTFAFAGAHMPVDDHNSTWGGVSRALHWGLGLSIIGMIER